MPKFRITYDTVDAENSGDYQFETVEASSRISAAAKFQKDHAANDYTGERKVIIRIEEINSN